MRKLLALYINEMIKMSKKVSVIVLLAIMVVVIFAFGGIVKYQSVKNTAGNNTNAVSQFQKQDMQRQLEDAKSRLASIKESKKSAEGDELQSLEREERSQQNQVDMLQYALDKDILLNSSSFLAEAVQKLFDEKNTVNEFKSIPASQLTDEQKARMTEAGSNVSILEKIIDTKDFKAYINIKNKEINNNTSMSEGEKKIYLESNDLRIKYNITGNGNANNYFYMLEKAKLSLLKGLDFTGNSQTLKPLTPEMRKKAEDQIAVIEYKFSRGIISNESSDNGGLDNSSVVIPVMLNIGNFMVVILVMILAGGSVSSEMSTGSIKSLIISPTKRWKIFTAKYFSLLTMGILAALAAYIFSLLANGIFFGFKPGAPYIFASNGAAHEISFYIYQLARLFTDFIVVVVFMTLAFMLSIITRNTAVSVAATIAVYFIGNTANAVLMQFVKGEWLRFIPFNNLNLTSKIFPNETLSQISGGITSTVNNSLMFSLVYVAVLLVCMIYIGLDSFNRRDIK